jgi:DNA gyrase subunit B
MPPKSNSYSNTNIQQITPREHMRLRPGMYIGGTDKRALHHMVYEVLDNAIEEVMIGECDRITVTLRTNQTVMIEDNSAGLPIEETDMPYYSPYLHLVNPNGEPVKKPYIEYIMTAFASKPMFSGQLLWGGRLHGIGLTSVNMLSKTCTIQIRRDGYLWEQSYEEGIAVTRFQRIRPLQDNEDTGNTIMFQPDFTIMDKNDFDFQIVAKRCKELAYLFPATTISVRDLRGEYLVEEIYHAPNGFIDWLQELNGEHETIHPAIHLKHLHRFVDNKGKDYDVGVTLAIQFVKAQKTIEKSLINSVPIPDGGVHIEAIQSELVEAINIKASTKLKWRDIQDGFRGIVHIQHPSPQFEGPTKNKLMSPDVGIAVKQAIQKAIHEHSEAFAMLVQYIVES